MTVGSMWKTEVGLDERGLSYRGAFVLFVVWINETLCPDPEPKAQSGLVTSFSFHANLPLYPHESQHGS